MRTLSMVLVLGIAGSAVACSKLYFDDADDKGKLLTPDAPPYMPGDAGLPDNLPADAEIPCGTDANPDAGGWYPDAGGWYPDAGGWYPDAGAWPDAGGTWPDAGGGWPDAAGAWPDASL